MNIDSLHQPPSVKASAIKWGLIHVGISVLLTFFSYLVSATLGFSDSKMSALMAIGSILVTIIGFIMSVVLMFLGMSQLKNESSPPRFKLVTSLKWSAIFIGIYIVLYGIVSMCLSAYAMSVLDLSEIPEGADAIMSSPLLVIIPVLLSLIISSIMLAAIGTVIGLILKTD